MKVAFDHQIFAMQRYGGISRYFVELASRLPSIATVSEAFVVAPFHVNYYLNQSSAQRFVRGRYVPYTFRGHSALVKLLNKVSAPAAWRVMDSDIVHETYYSKEPIGRARRRVLTVFDMIHELFASEFPDAAEVTAAKRAAVARADHVICISESTQRDLSRLFDVDPARTSVVYLGHSMIVEPRASRAADPRRAPVILFVGHRGGYKNFRRLAQAFASSASLRGDCELLAFGGRPFSAQESEELEQLGIRGNVRHEAGSDQELAAAYERATVFVCPSLYEGFGIPCLEAMSHGCPVISSDRASLPEVVGDAGVYVDPESVEELRAALERVVTTGSLQADLRSRGFKRLDAFSWNACAAATAGLYETLC